VEEKNGHQRYAVALPDLDYYQNIVRCQTACPVHTDARGYVTAIAGGEYEKAFLIAREVNPLASVCGRVCNAPCEGPGGCRRGQIDASTSIRALKRFVAERFGPEAERRLPKVREAQLESARPVQERRLVDLGSGFQLTSNGETALRRLGESRARANGSAPSRKVAIIGAGPAGFSCAHDLALLGYKPTIFEASSVTGGMMRLGIPEYRLPREILDLDVQAILDLGVELKLNTRLGADFSLADLREQGYEAVFIAIGAQKSRDLRIDGITADGVLNAVDFLLNVNMGYKVELGERVIVVGGGPVAFDVARTVRRLEAIQAPMSSEDLQEALEVARLALRRGASEVRMVCLESREEMPAPEIEIEEGLEEGINLYPRHGPKRIVVQNGKVVGLETLDVSSLFDADGRFNPTFVPGTEKVLETDTIIMAIGQTSDLTFIKEEDGIQVTPRGTILTDRETLTTSAPGIFAGGDVAFGPRIIIEAVAEGQRAARSIDAYLQGRQPRIVKRAQMKRVEPDDYLFKDYLRTHRRPVPSLPLERRIGIAEVELGFGEEQALEQAQRCLKCHIQTVFNGDLCIACGGCVDVCPEFCLKLVRLDELEGDRNLAALVQARYGESLEAFREGAAKQPALAMIKDDARCIRCGLCYKRCPVDAITMEALWFEEEIVYDDVEEEKKRVTEAKVGGAT